MTLEHIIKNIENKHEHKKAHLLHTDILNIKPLKPFADLIVTSPPYNLDINYGSTDDKLEYEEYLKFTRKWLTTTFKLANNSARLCLNIPLDTNKNGAKSIYADIIQEAKKSGWKYFTTIIWNEGNISRRTAWGSWMSASAPYTIAPVEMIAIMYKGQWKKHYKGTSTITRDEFMQYTNGLWTFNGESKKRIGHPAPYPIELPERCIKLFSYKEDTIFDPFVGSGTTLCAAIKNDRTSVGTETDKTYYNLAKERLQKF